MKKTIRINISGLIFNIDEDAYEKLQQYLHSITRKFINTKEGNEIIADVETRVAELFQERIGDRKEVVNLSDIDYVIEIMGKPEDFEEDLDEEPAQEEVPGKKTSRQIYRDTDKKVISGLAAGVANYFGIDPIIIRVIFVLMALFYGTSIFIYIILWIIIPEAKTRSQKLEMRGKDINLSNIETSIKEEFKNVKSNFEKWQKSSNFNRLKTNLGDIAGSFGKILVVISKLILILLGICFLIIGIGILGTFTGLFFFSDTMLSPASWNNVSFSIFDFASLFTDNFNARVGIISSYLVVLIPVLILIYLGLKFIFRFKAKSRYLGVVSGALWSVSLILLISSAVKIGFGMKAHQEVDQKYEITLQNSDTLYLKLIENREMNRWSSEKIKFDALSIDLYEDEFKIYGRPWLNITKSESTEIELSVTKSSKGENNKEAIQFAKNIKYDWQQDDSLLYFSDFFKVDGPQKVKDQNLQIDLKLPVGKVLYIGNDMDRILSYIENNQDYYNSEMENKYWIMTENGLSRLEDEINKSTEIEKNSEPIPPVEENQNSVKEEIDAMKKELDNM